MEAFVDHCGSAELVAVVNGEAAFRIVGGNLVPLEGITLRDVSKRERQDLQEWVIANPEMLGGEIKVVTSEFGRWVDGSGSAHGDRPDIIGLDSDGQLVVVELKRGVAQDTTAMQALNYAALASRFTLDQLSEVHAQFLNRSEGVKVTAEDALSDLIDFAPVSEETLRVPRVVLVAAGFGRNVTSTAVFLHQQLGLDFRLVEFRAYGTAEDLLITVSQLYPPAGIEDFVLTPEAYSAKRRRTERSDRKREANTVHRLIDADGIDEGTRLSFRAPISIESDVEDWLLENPSARTAFWAIDRSRPLIWEHDNEQYSTTGLAKRIIEDATGRTDPIQGPICWVNSDGQSLVELADRLAQSDTVDVLAPY